MTPPGLSADAGGGTIRTDERRAPTVRMPPRDPNPRPGSAPPMTSPPPSLQSRLPDFDADAAVAAASSVFRMLAGPPAASVGDGGSAVADASVWPGLGETAGSMLVISDAGPWVERLVPPGFTPPAAALLALAVGLACWLLGGRHLRPVLAIGGGLVAAGLAWWLIRGPDAGGSPRLGVDLAGPVLAAGLGGAAAACLLSRVLLAAWLAAVMAAIAPAAFIAWGSIAAAVPGPASAAASLNASSPAGTGASSRAGRIVIRGDAIAEGSSGQRLIDAVAALESRLTQAAVPSSGWLEAASEAGSAGLAAAGPQLGGTGPGIAGGLGLTAATQGAVQRIEARGRSLLARMPATRNPGDRRLLPWLALAGAAGGVLLALVRRQVAARVATAGVGAALVLLGGLHLPRGLVAGGWIGPDRPDLTLTAWILLSALGIAVQWSYRPRTADIGR